jgi:predicted dehydrogenase/threonine dehydrogenase-like Zn-dependent dehydrogenase
MKQLIQNFKTGDLYVDEVPIQGLPEKFVLVENQFSLISAGTEKATVSVGQASLLGKAKKRPDLVKQVLDNVKKEGLSATLQKVLTKLDSLKALGYSTSGTVLASLDSNCYFQPGDRVACAGQDYASHAEIVAVPQNLVVKIPDNVSFEEASFTTLGTIALQGVRQSNPKLGDKVCIIGLGLLGQITGQLLKANGCQVFGIDINPELVKLAQNLSVHQAMVRENDDLLSNIKSFTDGHGFDSVIITASASTNDPLELAAEISRKKGRVIIVGDVKMDVPRNPHFFRKELELKMSCSYGPGRYDTAYEESGNDYPFGYVRWTEGRNMEAFLQLISNGSIQMKPLISHIFDIEKAEEAYDIILGKKNETFTAMLLKYNKSDNTNAINIEAKLKKQDNKQINIGFVGAGSFATSYLIPTAQKLGSLDTIVTRTGLNAKNTATKFGFKTAATDVKSIIDNPNINTVFIATQHNTHAKYTIEALKAKKNVFVEKPLALTEKELNEVIETIDELKNDLPMIMVGFNRRFAPISQSIKKEFENIAEPLVMNFRVNAGFIPADHWIQDEKLGGGRIIGEICHFIDLMQFFTNSDPVSVFAQTINTKNAAIKNADNISITIKFGNGSIGTLVYIANGDKALPKEQLEIFGGNKSAVINDFRNGVLYKNNKPQKIALAGKGHKQEVEEFIKAIENKSDLPISINSMIKTTLTTFKIIDSIRSGLPQAIK